MKKEKNLVITNLLNDIYDEEINNVNYSVYNFNRGTINRSQVSTLNDSKKPHKYALEEKKPIQILYINKNRYS